MEKRFRDYVIFVVAVVICVTVTSGAVASDKVVAKEVKNTTVQLPDNMKELNALESKLLAESKVVSDELFEILTNMRMEKLKVTKSDPEIKALNAEITKLRAQVEKLTLEKSKDMSQWSKKRAALAEKHDDLRKELMAVRREKQKIGNVK